MQTPESVIAGTAFVLFSVVGVSVQLYKIWRRIAAQRATKNRIPGYATKGLVPFREFMAFMAFYLFFCSGLTRSEMDGMLVFTRLPAVLIQFVVVATIAFDRRDAWVRSLFVTCCGLLVFGGYIFGNRLFELGGDTTRFGWWMDMGLVAILPPFLFARFKHAWTVWYLTERSVTSALREVGCILKDLTGAWYAYVTSTELIFVMITHLASILTSVAILIAVGKNRRETEEQLLAVKK